MGLRSPFFAVSGLETVKGERVNEKPPYCL